MKNMRKVSALVLAVLLCCSLVLTACGGNSGEAAYKVSIADALGNPYTSGVVVKFMQNGQQAGMQVVNAEGVAEKTLPKGDYTVELQFTGSDTEYHYDKSGLTLSADKTELSVALSYQQSEESQPLTVQGKDTEAYPVIAGCTFVELDSEDRSYFLFAPTEAGTYEFSVIGTNAAIGYYGAPHFVQEHSAAEVTDNKFTMSVRADMIGTGNTGTTVMVIGIDATAEENAILAIQRTGDPQWTVEDEPWIVYTATTQPAPYTLPAGAKIGEFDLTAASDAYNLVLNETDGFYHLNTADGPLVLVRLGKNAETKFLAPFETVLERSGVSKYFYDDNGDFVKRESYNECLLQYIENVDEESGMYPLTEDLKYIIRSRGEHSGWWGDDNALYLFKDESGNKVPDINSEIAWLFMCCYIQ